MAQLVGGILGAVQPRHGQMLFHQRVHHGAADPLVTLGEKQGVPILAADGVAHRQIAGQRVLAGIVEVHHTHLVALAQHPHGVILNITKIQADQFGNTQAAVQEQRDNAEVPLLMLAIHGVQQGKGVLQRQIAGEGLHLLGRVNILAGIFLQKVYFIAQIVEERPDRGQFPCAGSGIQSFVRIFTILMLYAVTAEIGHVAVDIRQRDRLDEG